MVSLGAIPHEMRLFSELVVSVTDGVMGLEG